MKVIPSSEAKTLKTKASLQNCLDSISEFELNEIVETISIPRHFKYNSSNNKQVADWIFAQFSSFGYETHFQGKFSNVVALNPLAKSDFVILIGAHYDSVPNCPGADDNGSAVAGLIACAKAISKFAPHLPVCFVAFNCEEDGLVGSQDFVENYLSQSNLKIKQVHILEMIGYSTDKPNSQTSPANLPIKIPSVGNFLGIMGNQSSKNLVDEVLNLGKSYLPELTVLGLKLFLGIEKLVPDLGRSDHLPFWQKGIPALMWTDTADFRNPNYHRLTDTPETLNYTFLKKVTQLLLLQALNVEW
ncbi:MAG: M28 family peptidase [Pyrinomonadaceae bacterium]|nr:M28 family peptidase [Pyrinomonadaceae bacterium]